MAQFIAYNPAIKGNIYLLKPYFSAESKAKAKRLELFEKHHIDLNRTAIYPIQTILNFFKDLATSLGDMNLFLIGHSCAKDMHFDNIHNFKEIVEALNILYHSSYTLHEQPLYNSNTKEFTAGI